MKNILFNELIEKVKENKIPVHVDSRKVEKNNIFISLPILERNVDILSKQLEYMYNAAKSHPLHIVCEKEIAKYFAKDYPQYQHLLLIVDDVRFALGELASSLNESEKNTFPLIGVTGTNGKTTLTYLIEYFFNAQKKNVGVIGTVSYRYNGKNKNFEMDAPLTTPDCLFLHSFFHDMQEAESDYAIMEVSSHALDQGRVAGLTFDAAVFTNLTQDHLDYHPNMEDYFQVKSKLFKDARIKIINADDPYGLKLLAKHTNAIGYTLHDADISNKCLKGTILSSTPDGLELKLNFEDQEYILKTALIGQHNASNLLALIALGLAYGYKLEDFACLAPFNGVCGRLERVPNSKNIHAFVDYAHTPDALVNVLQALRTAGFEKIYTIFGCGGDRDTTKRPLMAQAVSKYGDVSILTSDNPRTEEPEKILDDVEKGLDSNKKYYREADRKKAILLACDLISKEENIDKIALLVAGKGHETYQIIGTTKYPFSDQEILKEI